MVLDFEGDDYQDLVAKIVLTGEPAVGKTSLRKRYLGEGFETSYLPTMGADFAIKKIEIDGDLTLHSQIWDLAGQRGYKRLRKYYLKNISGALLVFDLSRHETFAKLPSWIEEIYKAIKFPFTRIPILLIGNKADLDDKQVGDSEIQSYVQSLNKHEGKVVYVETSALTGYNVPVAFEKIARQIATEHQEKFKQKR